MGLFICIKIDLALVTLQELMCHKTPKNKTKNIEAVYKNYFFLYLKQNVFKFHFRKKSICKNFLRIKTKLCLWCKCSSKMSEEHSGVWLSLFSLVCKSSFVIYSQGHPCRRTTVIQINSELGDKKMYLSEIEYNSATVVRTRLTLYLEFGVLAIVPCQTDLRHAFSN